MTVTERLCRAILEVTADSLSEPVLAAAHQVALDGLSVALAGTVEQGPRILSEHIREQGGAPRSTTIGFGFRTTPGFAAYLNGTSMHVLDYEPMSSPATHATSTCLPAVLALAEHLGATGRECMTALVKGVEMQGRIRFAGVSHDSHDEVFHHPGIVGAMGSAVAAGHLLGLKLEQLRNALGMAASRAGCVTANAGTMTKATHCGMAAANGLDAALLAQRGFTANPEVFDHRNGYVRAFFGEDFEPERLLAFGKPFRMVDPGYAIKLFPSKYTTHWGITAGLTLHGKIPDPGRIEAVEIITPDFPDVDRPAPPTGLAGKFSFQYTVACALLDGEVRIPSFTDERRFRPDMEQLLGRVAWRPDPARMANFDKMSAQVNVTLKDGTRLEENCLKPKAHYDLPPLDPEEHLVKVRDCLGELLAEPQVERCVSLGSRFVELTAAEVGELMETLSLAGQGAPGGAG